MSKVFWIILAMVIAYVSIIGVSARCNAEDEGQPSITVDEILRAWQQRQERIPSARFAWKRSRSDEHRFSLVEETHQLTQDDYYECAFVADNVFLRLPGSPVDTFSHVVSRFGGPQLTKDQKSTLTKFQKSGAELAPSKDYYIYQRLLTPASATELWLPAVANGNYPKAWKYQLVPSSDRVAQLDLWFQPAADTTGQIALMFSQAPLIAIRPFSPIFGEIQPDRCSLSSQTRTVAGNECLILEETLGNPAHMRSFWVDPTRDFTILRYQGITDFHLAVQLDFEHERHPVKGWIPKSWTAIELLSSTKTIRRFASTENVHVNFDETADSLPTQLKFSPGTWIVDETSQQHFLVQESGMQPLTDAVDTKASSPPTRWEQKSASVYANWVRKQTEENTFRAICWTIGGMLIIASTIVLGYWTRNYCRRVAKLLWRVN